MRLGAGNRTMSKRSDSNVTSRQKAILGSAVRSCAPESHLLPKGDVGVPRCERFTSELVLQDSMSAAHGFELTHPTLCSRTDHPPRPPQSGRSAFERTADVGMTADAVSG